MSEQLNLQLNIDADTKALERKLKGLNSKIDLPVNLEWQQAKSDIDKLQNQLKALANTEADPKVLAALNQKLQVYKAQASAIDKLETTIAKANATASVKGANLSVAKARLEVLEDELNLTRELAQQGKVNQSQLKLKEAQTTKAKAYVNQLESEIQKLQEIAKLQGNVSRLQAQTTQSVKQTGTEVNTFSQGVNTASGGLQGLAKKVIGFGIATEVFNAAIEFLVRFKDVIIASTLELEKLRTQLDFSTGDGAAALEKLYTQSQQLGLSFTDLASGYATFSAALKGTPLELQTDKMFGDVSKAVAGLKLSASDTEGVFRALTQMASKGKISLEEYNGQLGDRLPITSKAGVTALQSLVSKGLVPVKEFNKSVIGTNAELSKSYQVTSKDVLAYISSGKAQAQLFLPELTKAMGDALSNVNTEGLQASLNRAKNALMVFAATVGTSLAPVLTDLLDRFTNIVEYFKKNASSIGDSFKPFIIAGQAIVGVFDIIDVAIKKVFGKGVIEILISSLDELAIAALAIFGAPLIGAIAAAASALAPILAAVAAGTAAVYAFKWAIGLLFKALDALTGGKVGEWITDLVNKIKEIIDNAKAANAESDAVKTTAQGVGKAFTDAGNGVGDFVSASKGISEVVDVVQQLKDELDLIDLEESLNTADIENKLTLGSITVDEANTKKLDVALGSTEKRLETTKDLLSEVENQIATTVDAAKLEELTKEQKELTRQIPELEIKLAQDVRAVREASFKEQLNQINQASTDFESALKQSENKRLEIVRTSTLSGKQLETERINQRSESLDAELALEQKRIDDLQALKSTVVAGSEQEKQIIDALTDAESKRTELLKEQGQLIQDKFELSNQALEAEISSLGVDKEVLDTKAKLVDLQIDLLNAQQALNDANSEYKAVSEAYNASIIQARIDSIQFELDVATALKGLDSERKTAILERLGLTEQIGLNAIELAQSQRESEAQLIESKRQQLLIEQESERNKLEASKREIELEKSKLKFLIQTQKIELEIAKLQQEQALNSAMAARDAAKISGDTKALAQAELMVVQARQREKALQAQAKLIQEQSKASQQQLEIESKVVKTELRSLEISQEKERTEFELGVISEQRLKALEAETELINLQAESRTLNRDLALSALKYGSETVQNQAEILALELKAKDALEAQTLALEYVQSLRGGEIQSTEDLVILQEAQNSLSQASLELLDAEYQLENALANEIAQEREASLQRQNDILNQRKTLLEAELGLSQAQADLEQAKLDRRLIEIDRKEGLGLIDESKAAEERFKIERQKLKIEAEMLSEQQKADIKRLEIEQQIEVMRLRASQAEAEVVKARAEASLADSQGALSRAIESGDQDAIDAAEAAIEASQKGIDAATTQVDLIGEQIDQTLELQKIQLETIETQQKADIERLKNSERELEVRREIAALESSNSNNNEDENNAGFRVSGGGVSAGKSYIVGEQGTELFQGADGSTKLLGVKGQHAFTPNVPGKIISNQALEQVIAANVMRSDSAVVEAIQRGFKTSGNEFARLAGILANRITKPAVITNNYGSNTPSFDANKAKLGRL